MSVNEADISLQSIRVFLYENREIEFSDNSNSYFAEPVAIAGNKYQYKIWTTHDNSCIFQGNPDDLLSFRFPNGKTLLKNLDDFHFSYIL